MKAIKNVLGSEMETDSFFFYSNPTHALNFAAKHIPTNDLLWIGL